MRGMSVHTETEVNSSHGFAAEFECTEAHAAGTVRKASIESAELNTETETILNNLFISNNSTAF